jgi:hypothetical protein
MVNDKMARSEALPCLVWGKIVGIFHTQNLGLVIFLGCHCHLPRACQTRITTAGWWGDDMFNQGQLATHLETSMQDFETTDLYLVLYSVIYEQAREIVRIANGC